MSSNTHGFRSRYFNKRGLGLPPSYMSTKVNEKSDISDRYTKFERMLFNLFSSSVAKEARLEKPPETYKDLISTISFMNFNTKNMSIVHDQGKNILVRLFPPFILPLYKLSFAKFPKFSGFMNVWVTHFTTSWLMGNSSIYDIELPSGEVLKQKGLLVEKCLFLEEAACLKTCIHSCKIPTQRFFLEEMDLPVTLRPNITDYSCRFEFNLLPPPLDKDEVSKMPCIDICSQPLKRKSSKNSVTLNNFSLENNDNKLETLNSCDDN